MKPSKRRAQTTAVRGASDLEKRNGPVAPEIYQTSTFEVTDNEEQIRVTTTDRYSTRWGNPTITLAE
jgi:cystathionine beta-lyase/cystathionine gamma-synthase